MASAKTETNKPEAPEGAAVAATAAEVPGEKKKNRVSKRWKNTQKIEKGVTKAARRISDAIAEGVQVFVERRDASASKKKDGALRDLNKNLSKAVRKTLRKGTKAPGDVLNAIAKVNLGKSLKIGKTLFK